MRGSVTVDQASRDNLPEKQEVYQPAISADRRRGLSIRDWWAERSVGNPRLEECESKPSDLHWELPILIPRVADDPQLAAQPGRRRTGFWHPIGSAAGTTEEDPGIKRR